MIEYNLKIAATEIDLKNNRYYEKVKNRVLSIPKKKKNPPFLKNG